MVLELFFKRTQGSADVAGLFCFSTDGEHCDISPVEGPEEACSNFCHTCCRHSKYKFFAKELCCMISTEFDKAEERRNPQMNISFGRWY